MAEKAFQLRRAIICLALATASIVTSGRCGVIHAQTELDVAQISRPGVLYIKVYGTDPETKKTASDFGSGFYISANQDILTASHLFKNKAGQPLLDIYASVSVGTRNGPFSDIPRDNISISADPEIDFALLRSNLVGLPAILPLCWKHTVAVGERVIALGYPDPLDFDRTEGRIRSVSADFWYTDAPINHGDSGGPIETPEGEVIGLSLSGFTPHGAQEGLNVILPLRNVVALLEKRIQPLFSACVQLRPVTFSPHRTMSVGAQANAILRLQEAPVTKYPRSPSGPPTPQELQQLPDIFTAQLVFQDGGLKGNASLRSAIPVKGLSADLCSWAGDHIKTLQIQPYIYPLQEELSPGQQFNLKGIRLNMGYVDLKSVESQWVCVAIWPSLPPMAGIPSWANSDDAEARGCQSIGANTCR